MPITPAGATAVIYPNLLAVGMLGTQTPRFSYGLAIGISLWTPTVAVSTVDAGAIGVGTGLAPLVVPQPLLLTNFLVSFTASGLLGVMAPLKILGLANGLMLAFGQGIIQTVHPLVGSGAGVAKFTPPPAVPNILEGMAAAGITGTSMIQMATAIGVGLMQTFGMLVLPVPIVGPAGPGTSAGTGSGSII